MENTQEEFGIYECDEFEDENLKAIQEHEDCIDIDEEEEEKADLISKYEICQNCGERLTEISIYDVEGNWESTEQECLNCEQTYKVIN